MTRSRALGRLGLAATAVCTTTALLVALTLAEPAARAPWWTAAWWTSIAAAWTAWASVLGRCAVDLVSLARGRTVGPGVLGRLALQLAASWAVLIPTAASASAGAPSPHGGAPIAAVAHVVLRTSPTRATTLPAVATPRRYVVAPGDCLWTIAARELGDPLRWRAIWNANAGRIVAPGRRFEVPGLIDPGWVLLLPGGSAHPAGPPRPRASSSSTPASSVRYPVTRRGVAVDGRHGRPTRSATGASSSAAPVPQSVHRPIASSVDALDLLLGGGILALATAVGVRRRRTRHAEDVREDLGAFVAHEALESGADTSLVEALVNAPDGVPFLTATGATGQAVTDHLVIAPPGSTVVLAGSEATTLRALQLLVLDALSDVRPTAVVAEPDDVAAVAATSASTLFLGAPDLLDAAVAAQVTCVVVAEATTVDVAEDGRADSDGTVEVLGHLLDVEADPSASRPWLRLLTTEPRLDGLAAALDARLTRRATELAGYLALHRDRPVTSEELRTEVFGHSSGDGSKKSLANTASALRQALGLDADGAAHLPPATRAGRFHLGTGVHCDLVDAREFVEVARTATEPAVQLAAVRAACELIEDRPLRGARLGWEWLANEGTLQSFGHELVAEVERAVEVCVDLGHLDLASLLLDRAGLVVECSEHLVRASLTLSAARGDLAAFVERWQHHLDRLDALEPGLAPSSTTEAHYWALQRRLAG